MARSWRRPALWHFTLATVCPTRCKDVFDLIVLHLVLLLARLDCEAASARGIGQKLFDLFCRDLDANLREMGVGDLAVPKRMRHFGEAFYGRQAAYRAALRSPDGRALEKALARNIFNEVNGDGPRRLARYARDLLREFEVHDRSALLRGAVAFPKPEPLSCLSQNRGILPRPGGFPSP